MALGRGGVVGGELRAAHNVAVPADAVDPAARRVDLGKGAVGNAAAVKAALPLVENIVTARPLPGDAGRRDFNAKIAEKAQYPLFRPGGRPFQAAVAGGFDCPKSAGIDGLILAFPWNLK